MGLSAKQKRFAHEYSVDHNGSQAAIRAGYAEKSARYSGSRLLANVAVRQGLWSNSSALGIPLDVFSAIVGLGRVGRGVSVPPVENVRAR